MAAAIFGKGTGFWLMALMLVVSQRLNAQVLINEACSNNASGITDIHGDASDWFELLNTSDTSVLLTGFRIEDSENHSWVFPAIGIPPNSFLLIFSSGKNLSGTELHTSFRLDNDGDELRLYDDSGVLTDKIEIPALQLNHSAGRFSDGNVSRVYIFDQPSPGFSNNASKPYNGYVPDPVFSMPSGYYPASFSLSISTVPQSRLQYSTDGRRPMPPGEFLQTTLTISTPVAISAVAFDISDSLLPSLEVVHTYIVGYQSTLPVWSLTVDPDYLFGWEKGIYVLGPDADSLYPYYGANFWQDWEVPVYVELFEPGAGKVLGQHAGLSINGGSVSRNQPMKSLRLTCRDRYGEDAFHHRFFSGRQNMDFKTLVLRNSGGDFNKTHFRDGSLHSLIMNQADVDVLAYRPSVVFINGAYWGIHNIRERVSRHYLSENYGADPDSVDILEEDSTVIEGDFQQFEIMFNFITGNDMSSPAMYDTAAAMLDISSFCDYFICETLLNNIDWPYNNIKYWREKKSEKKWRYILLDLDISLGNMGWAPAAFDHLGRVLGPYGDENRHVAILRSLLNNADFRLYFINRYADLANTLFRTENVEDHIGWVMKQIETEMPLHFARWGGSMDGWYAEINGAVKPFVNDRPMNALGYVRDNFGLKSMVPVTLDVWPSGSGSIVLNTITPAPYPWQGIYFNGAPVSVKANPASGFIFLGWETEGLTQPDVASPELTVNPESPCLLRAVFGPRSEYNLISVVPNPVRNKAMVRFASSAPGKACLSVMNPAGNLVIRQQDIPIHEGENFISIETEQLPGGMYLIILNTGEESLQAKMIIIP